MRLDLAGKTILLTGASRGVGAATARLCAQARARVIGHASRESAESAALVAAGIVADGDFLFEDLRAPGAGLRLAVRAIERAGRLDGLVNNAGVYQATPLDGAQEAWDSGWEDTLAVNLRAPADLARAAVAHFRRQGGGRVVNIASRAGHRGDGPDHAAYAASKGALLSMTKTYARALAGENILFYAIAPGWIETRMAPEDVAARAKAVGEIPLGRVASPEEVAALAVFLLSDACPSATGATFDVNGASYVR
ncbi:SDR family NAD(P)-dependent oxidoreductase [Amphiplicatus metriothermophilus]|uniref:NAD(P)-dependent dehydrogenase, short-chain alcohol dehydrogenase family n=1 Tax=Amphiplicatus metriothermophilus TaxID=1519374 RepID=A0A239PZ07_9PROT|nr:SDR family oxidoreductase [Amphiplicatus metriothermophilus]MBB5518307.1 NAD(P)-dependent dehydrogenase (short-subunit alcohol dehydrogenase family) [Amphiplicatus metriothermophilus]SNT75561.1 NAD(P)-dependent dehydrogenase, short-chain alcohol dehydrogenase family [Amphiplicatus metriothermophilus]